MLRLPPDVTVSEWIYKLHCASELYFRDMARYMVVRESYRDSGAQRDWEWIPWVLPTLVGFDISLPMFAGCGKPATLNPFFFYQTSVALG